jgi:hypothetical protein
LFCITNSRCFVGRSPGRVVRPADRVFLAALARMLPRDRQGSLFCAAGDDPALASVAAHAPLDVSASAARQTCNRRWRLCADCAAGFPRAGSSSPKPGRVARRPLSIPTVRDRIVQAA